MAKNQNKIVGTEEQIRKMYSDDIIQRQNRVPVTGNQVKIPVW